MTWPFCPHCGTVLNPPEQDDVKCSECSFHCKFADFSVQEVVTRCPPRPRQPWAKDEDEEGEAKELDKHAVIAEPCPKCGHPELYFYTMQLRSVDEGSTVFYECPKCAHKYSQNN